MFGSSSSGDCPVGLRSRFYACQLCFFFLHQNHPSLSSWFKHMSTVVFSTKSERIAFFKRSDCPSQELQED